MGGDILRAFLTSWIAFFVVESGLAHATSAHEHCRLYLEKLGRYAPGASDRTAIAGEAANTLNALKRHLEQERTNAKITKTMVPQTPEAPHPVAIVKDGLAWSYQSYRTDGVLPEDGYTALARRMDRILPIVSASWNGTAPNPAGVMLIEDHELIRIILSGKTPRAAGALELRNRRELLESAFWASGLLGTLAAGTWLGSTALTTAFDVSNQKTLNEIIHRIRSQPRVEITEARLRGEFEACSGFKGCFTTHLTREEVAALSAQKGEAQDRLFVEFAKEVSERNARRAHVTPEMFMAEFRYWKSGGWTAGSAFTVADFLEFEDQRFGKNADTIGAIGGGALGFGITAALFRCLVSGDTFEAVSRFLAPRTLGWLPTEGKDFNPTFYEAVAPMRAAMDNVRRGTTSSGAMEEWYWKAYNTFDGWHADLVFRVSRRTHPASIRLVAILSQTPSDYWPPGFTVREQFKAGQLEPIVLSERLAEMEMRLIDALPGGHELVPMELTPLRNLFSRARSMGLNAAQLHEVGVECGKIRSLTEISQLARLLDRYAGEGEPGNPPHSAVDSIPAP